MILNRFTGRELIFMIPSIPVPTLWDGKTPLKASINKRPLKTEGCHDTNFVITDSTAGCLSQTQPAVAPAAAKFRADSRFAPSQWETTLQSNAVSQWLGANLESALKLASWQLLIFSDFSESLHCWFNVDSIIFSLSSFFISLFHPCVLMLAGSPATSW